VGAVVIVVLLKIAQLGLQIRRAPEQDPVQVLAPNRPDQSLDERVRKWHVRDRFDFNHIENSKVSLTLMESIERIMI